MDATGWQQKVELASTLRLKNSFKLWNYEVSLGYMSNSSILSLPSLEK